MTVTYPPADRLGGDVYQLLRRATAQFEDAVGAYGRNAAAQWHVDGLSPVRVRVAVKDDVETAAAPLTGDALRDPEEVERLILELWGELLDARADRLQCASGDGAGPRDVEGATAVLRERVRNLDRQLENAARARKAASKVMSEFRLAHDQDMAAVRGDIEAIRKGRDAWGEKLWVLLAPLAAGAAGVAVGHFLGAGR